MAPKEDSLSDVMEMLAIVSEFRAVAADPADLACLTAGDDLAALIARHFPDAGDRVVAGTALLIAITAMAAMTGNGIPVAAAGTAVAVAGGQLFHGGPGRR